MSINSYKLTEKNEQKLCGELKDNICDSKRRTVFSVNQILSLQESLQDNKKVQPNENNESPNEDFLKFHTKISNHIGSMAKVPKKFSIEVTHVVISSYKSSSFYGHLCELSTGNLIRFHRDIFGTHFWMVHFLQMMQVRFSVIQVKFDNQESTEILKVDKDFLNTLQKKFKEQGILKKYKKQIMQAID